MKVAIIGTGKMSLGLALAFSKAGHEIRIGARDLAKAESLAERCGNDAFGGSIADAVKPVEVVIFALPFAAAGDAINAADHLTGKVIVDISNPVSADYKALLIGHTTSAAEEIQKLAPQASVVKAFNTIFAGLLDSEARRDKKLQVFIAGDDAKAKALVAQLAESIGFKAMDSGALSNSRFIEPIGEMNILFGYFLGQGTAIAPAWVQL